MRYQPSEFVQLLTRLFLVVGLVAGISAAFAQDRGVCVTAEVPSAFVLPDGSLHPAGRIVLCTVQAFAPAVGLHRIRVDDQGTSLAMSRRGHGELQGDSPAGLLFRQAKDAPLDLIGYFVSLKGKCWSYSLRRSTKTGFASTLPSETARSIGEIRTTVASYEN